MANTNAPIIDGSGYGEELILPRHLRSELVTQAAIDHRPLEVKWVLRVRSIPGDHPDSDNYRYTAVAEVQFSNDTRAIYGLSDRGWHCFMD